jgi:hypothetical protein
MSTQQAQQLQEPSVAQLSDCLIISIKEARKLLGVGGDELSDDELAATILELTQLAQELLKVTKLPDNNI